MRGKGNSRQESMKAHQRKQNFLGPRRCFWVTLKVRTKCLFFVSSHREVTLSRLSLLELHSHSLYILSEMIPNDLKEMYTLTFHRLLWSILNICLPRKTKTIQKKGIWSFLRHLTLIIYLSKVTKTIFTQLIFYVKFLALFKPAVKNKGSHLRKGSYLHLTLKIDHQNENDFPTLYK